jgi:ATP-dependent helicase/nuclease subunit A
MTIHKAKGLEFGTVILPGLDRAPGKSDSPLMRWKELPNGNLLLAPIKETGSDAEPAYDYLKALDREAEDTEAARLLYVAATRAKHRLHLLACPKKTMPPKRSLLACAWPVAGNVFAGVSPPQEVSSNTPTTTAPFLLKRLAAGWTPPPPPPAAAWTPPPEGRDGELPAFDWAKEPARLAGIVAHRWLQQIGEDELRGWDTARVEKLRPRVATELKRAGVPPAAMKRACGLVIDAIKNSLADERGRWILGPHPFARSEHKLSTPARKRMRIDRYIEDAKGVRWIVDFKTGEHGGGSVETYLDDQVTRYAPQLDEYARATGATRRALYFPLLKGWRDW